ncbi:SGNH/GDSL hydrolase family protein [Nocardioides sp. Kera G14]|uniref:SGNH/GDSL hydrolase family protein n=1 Tax=Nocardioides sp. Kera G14 TaxID=2884264 RepID=UPI001D118466|nr:SGNH/GDSL hydrolase family protein [Nocardioides sp. Kera G14]UDY23228.1 SGNH/GDSL hydrolase family protein [Nocardioides sp. Kera G14]
MAFAKYVALGDSFTEGVGDTDPSRPNGVRGWADRVAEVLATEDPTFRYANLAIRGRKLPAILDEQLAPALALEPDLVTIYAGANDMLRPSVDIDVLMARYDDAITNLAATGATVVMFTAFAAKKSRFFAMLRGRWAYYNECVREIHDRHAASGADMRLVDYWRMDEFDDWGYWDVDRLHMSSAGHELMSHKVLDVLGVPHAADAPAPLAYPVLSPREQRAHNRAWAREHLAPWVKRRLTGTSSGDSLSPRFPDWTAVGA